MISDGINGRLARALDVGAFARVIEQLWADSGERRRLGIQGEGHVRETFGWTPVARSHVEVLERVRTRLASVQRSRPAFSGWTVPSRSGGGA